nr:unnamed protein product [Spirometra erinaceieuropaei]
MTESHSGEDSDSQETFSREAFQKQRQKRRQAMKRAQDTMAFYNVGYRLNRRKKMFEQRCLVTDFSLLFAILGIILMVIETELTMAGVYTKASMGSFILKSMITCTTLALVGLIIAYHVQVVRILSFDDSIEDWRIAWDRRRVLRLAVEILICAVHPFPGDFKFSWFSTYHFHTNAILSPCSQCQNGSIVSQSGMKEIRPPLQGSVDFATFGTSAPLSANSGTYVVFPTTRVVPVDIFLSLPMFLRLYLVFRVVVLHSKLFTDTGSRSIGAMNKVSIDTSFIFKTFMTISPGTILVGFILGFWLVLSWTLRVCESGIYDPALGTIFNAMWLIAVTFLSIGYGDVVANTYCGRSISIITGVLGSLCTALVVAVFARRLELSKAEKHVIQFMMENQLTKKMKFYAANVLRETWLIYKRHQRKFLHAIHGLRQMKLEQRRLQDNANTLVDLAKVECNQMNFLFAVDSALLILVS